MEQSHVQTHKKYNTYIALFILFTTFLSYITTVAPTVAFWDCGEYIGASHSLGIPHPPGNPLYVLIGRFFSMTFFFFKQVAYRINLISVFSSAFTAMFLYLIIVRAMISWIGVPDTLWKRITVYVSGVVGALFAAFSYTFWFNAVEASVYNPSILIVVICVWLAIVWAQSSDPNRDLYLILFSYLAFLGIAIHMMAMLALIPVFLFIIISDQSKLKDWRVWIISLSMGAVIYHVSTFLWLGPLAVTVSLVMSFVEKRAAKQWRFCFWVAFFALLGYSVHLYIPIRSALKPIIDENHPVITIDESGKVNWSAFKGFLERKQYGTESMITRSFHRLGKWSKQFGIDGHMGYGGFHITQFFHFGRSIDVDRNNTVFENWGAAGGTVRLLIYLLPTFFMLWGWSYFYKKNPKLATLLIFLFVLCSVALVLYMNFADGTLPTKRDYQMWVKNGRQGQLPLQHREVRIRDYFFTSGFVFLGMWIGLACGCLLHGLFTSKNRFFRTQLAPILVVLFAVSPLLPFTQNYAENNRTKDWIPYDYAYNLLMSCEKDGILFTNGDNDTFPLWFLQEAEGIRKDVRIVNLSLLNTSWYIKQLKELEPKVPISYTEYQIDHQLDHQLNPLKSSVQYKMPNAGLVVTLPGRDQKMALRVQDQMVVNIVDANAWKKPIYFAVTVSSDNLMGIDPYLQMQGLVYRVLPEAVPQDEKVNIDRILYLLDKVYSYRNLGDASVPLSETASKLMSNYAISYIQVAISLRQPLIDMKNEVSKLEKQLSSVSDTTDSSKRESLQNELTSKKEDYTEQLDMVINKLDQCVSLMPWEWRPRLLRQEVLMAHDRFDEAFIRLEEARKVEPDNLEYLKLEARLHELRGDKEKANQILKRIAEKETDPWMAYDMLSRNYIELELYDSAIHMMNQFQAMYPGDRRAALRLKQIEMLKTEALKKQNSDSSTMQKTDSTVESQG